MSAGDLIIITHRGGKTDFAVLEGVNEGRLQVHLVGSSVSRSIADPKRVTLLLHRAAS